MKGVRIPAFVKRTKVVKEEAPEKKPVTLAERHFAMTKARDAIVAVFEFLDPSDGLDQGLAGLLNQAQHNLSAHLFNEARIADLARAEVGGGRPRDEALAEVAEALKAKAAEKDSVSI